MSKTKKEFEPDDAERRHWVRSAKTMDRGYLVDHGGVKMVKYDRPDDPTVVPYDPAVWLPDVDRQPLSPAQVAQVAFAADAQLCYVIGMRGPMAKKWIDLPDGERAKWCRGEGPEKPTIRAKVFKAVWAQLEGLMR